MFKLNTAKLSVIICETLLIRLNLGIQKSQEASPLPAGDHRAAMDSKTDTKHK